MPCLGRHPQFYYPVEGNGQKARRFALKPFIGNCKRVNSRFKIPVRNQSVVQDIPL